MRQAYLHKTEHTVQLMVEDRPFIILGGELHNSTSSSAQYTEQFLRKLKDMNLNTVLLSVSWEQIEPAEDTFDFTVLEQLIEAAHSYGLRLVLLWFGTWKNAASTYPPLWVKTDLLRFPRAVNKSGKPNAAISCFSEQCCAADLNAFRHMMRHIKEVDTHQTVIAVQVQNETGLLGTARDYSEPANVMFANPVPQVLAEYLRRNRESLSPKLKEHIRYEDLNLSWAAAFGAVAEEVFMCYYTAQYIDKIAASGKAEYDLPMLVNGWPEQCENEAAGLYPSGGPTSQMLAIWRCGAPSIDILAGDLYLENFTLECAAYTRLPDNPLFIPEARKDKWVMAHAFYAIGNHDALCFSPFGIEQIEKENNIPENANIQSIFQTMTGGDTSDLVTNTYAVLGNMMSVICRYRGTGRMKGIMQHRLMDGAVMFSKYSFKIVYRNFIDIVKVPGGGLMIELSPDEFLVAGANFTAIPVPRPGEPEQVEIVRMEEGHFDGETWVCDRLLNGDELHIVMEEKPRILRIRLFGI